MLKIFMLNIIFFLVTLSAYDGESLYRDNTAAYINKITKSIAKQYKDSKNAAMIQKKTIILTPMVDINDFTSTLPITKRIDENIIYEMSINGFKMIDTKAMKILGMKDIISDYILVSTYTNYKYEMVINSRIVDKKTGVVCASSQVKVPRKILKNVDKLYNKNSWFSPQEK